MTKRNNIEFMDLQIKKVRDYIEKNNLKNIDFYNQFLGNVSYSSFKKMFVANDRDRFITKEIVMILLEKGIL